MNLESIKKAMLDSLGNPESGIFADWADHIAAAILDAHSEKKSVKPDVETRIVEVKETR